MSTDLQLRETSESVCEPDAVEVRRDGPLAAAVGVLSGAVAVAYLQRAVGSGSALDWLVCLAMTAVAAAYLLTAFDSRGPLMVLDAHGVRVRRGHAWQGVAWPEVERVEHAPRDTMLRDGRLAVVDVDGRELAVRLSLSTRLVGANWHELTEALLELSEGRTDVLELVVVTDADADADADAEDGDDAEDEVVGLEPTREPVVGRRTEVVLPPNVAPTGPDPDLEAASWDPDAEVTTTILIDGVEPAESEPVRDPVIGQVLRAARVRVGLSVDQLAERTRIRPHVIEAVELDDFIPCGGDFYARGHLRTLARILGVDAVPLLATYDERYADAPVDPRCVFEAELATGGSIRATRGGLNWSVLVATVMAVVLVWSIARLVMDGPVPLADRPVLNGSPSGKAALSGAHTVPKVPVTFTAATGGAEVIVRDGSGEVVFDDRLAFMQTAKVDVAPPVRISSTDGGLRVSIDGDQRGALGETGQDAQNVFVVR